MITPSSLTVMITGTIAVITGATIIFAPSVTSSRVFPNVDPLPNRWRGVGLLIAGLGTLLIWTTAFA